MKFIEDKKIILGLVLGVLLIGFAFVIAHYNTVKADSTSSIEVITEEETTQQTTEQPTEVATQPETIAETPSTEVVTEQVVNISQVNETVWANTSVNVRSSYSASSEKIGSLNYAGSVTRTGVCDNGWSQIDYKGKVGYVNSNYIQTTEIQTTALVPKETVIQEYTGRVELEGTADVSLARAVDAQLNMLPQSLVDGFFNSGWRIIVTSYDIGSTYYGDTSLGRLSGITMFQKKVIYIANTKKEVKRAVIHEFGHYFDCLKNFPSQRADFNNIYSTEVNTFYDIQDWGDHHCTSAPIEYFAECFMHYFVYPDNLQGTAPQTYNYINNLLSQ